MDLEDLKFFIKGKKFSEVFDEFGEVYGANLVKELLERGLIEEHQYLKDAYLLTGAGEKIGLKRKIKNCIKNFFELLLFGL